MTGNAETGDAGSTWYPAWRKYDKMTDIVEPSPSMLWVFVDEHPDSINDGWMIEHSSALRSGAVYP